MGNQDNVVLLRVQLSEEDTEKRLAALVLSLEQVRKAQQQLTKDRETGKVSAEEYAQQSVKLANQLTVQRGEYATLQRSLVAFQAVTNSAAGSTDELAAKSKLLTSQVNALSEEERKTEGGKALVAQLKAINDALIAQGKNVSDGRRNVGNYEAALKSAGVGAKDLTGGLSTVTNTALKPFQGELDRGTGFLGKFKSGSDLVGKGLAGLKASGETGAQGFKAVAAGVALTGLGVFLLLLQAVVTYFTNTAEGGKLLKQALAGVGAVVNTLTGAVYGLGKGLVAAAQNPEDAFKKLLSFLKEQVLNRFAAFGVILEGLQKHDFKQVANGIIQLNTGFTNGIDRVTAYAKSIAESAGNAVDLTAKLQALAKQRKENEISEVEEKGRVETLLRLSKDRTLSAADRLNKLREAGKIENELSAKSLDINKQELALIQQRNVAKGLNRTADEVQEERDKRKEYKQTEAERNSTLAGIKARQSRFILEERAGLKAATTAAAAAAKQRAKDAVAAKQTENELALVAVEKGTIAELALKRKAIDLAADFELAGEKKTQDQIKLIRAKAEGDKLDLLVAYQQKENEAEKKRIAAHAAEVKREYEEASKNLESYLNEQRAQVECDYAEGKVGQNVYQKQINAIDKAGYQAALINAEDYGQDKAKIIKAQADLEIKEAHRVKDEKKKIEDIKKDIQEKGFQAATTITDLIIENYGRESAAGTVALVAKKTLALAEVAINTEKILIENGKTAANISNEYPYVGPALAAAYLVVADAAAIAAAAAAVSSISKYEQGGVVYGPSHKQGGIDMYHTSGARIGNMQGGEVVLTKGVWDNPLLRPLASALNVMGGGVPLLPRAYMAVGGVTQPVILDQLRGNAQPGIDYDQLARAMSRVNVWATIQDVEAGLVRRAETKRLSNS